VNQDWREFLAERGYSFSAQHNTKTALAQAPGPGPVDLSHFGVLSFIGPDACGFLQGYLTADLDDLDTAGVQRAAYCNLKGRVIADFLVVAVEGGVQLVAHRSVLTAVADSLAKYLPFSRSRLTDVSDDVILFGRTASPPELLVARRLENGWVAALPDGREWVCAAPDQARDLWDASVDAAAPGDTRSWDLADVRAGIVHCVAATSEAFLPQSLGLVDLGAVSFTKGCYLGQEVVARAQHRGQVKRILTHCRWQGRAPEIGTKLTADDGKEGGTLVALAPTGADVGEALVVVNRAGEAKVRTLTAPGVTFTLVD
jgi:folate-binding protein YgfZ